MNGIRTIRTSFIADVKIDHGDNKSIYSLKCGTSTLKLKARQGLCLILRQHTDIIKIICSNSTITFDLLLWHCSTTKSHLSNKHQYLEYSSPFSHKMYPQCPSKQESKLYVHTVLNMFTQPIQRKWWPQTQYLVVCLARLPILHRYQPIQQTSRRRKTYLGQQYPPYCIKVAMLATKTSQHTQIIS